MDNFLSRYQAAREAEERARMTHYEPQRHDGPPLTQNALLEFGAEAFTPYGNYVSARDAKDDFDAGRYGYGAFNAAMALPGLGIVGAVGRKLARAKKLGFDTENVWHHGTNAMIPFFDDAKLGTVTGNTTAGSRLASTGHFATNNPQVADDFAEFAADTQGGTPTRIPLYARKEGQTVIDYTSQPDLDISSPADADKIAANLLKARKEGAKTVILKGVKDSVSKQINDVLVIIDPSHVRRTDAKFDPAKRGSNSLMASLAGLGFGAQLLPSSNPDSEL